MGALTIRPGQETVAVQDALAAADDKPQLFQGVAAATEPFRVYPGGRRNDPDTITGPQPGRFVHGGHASRSERAAFLSTG